MADNLFSMGSYKLTALTVKTQTVDINGALVGSRNWLIYQDAPRFAMSSFKTTTLVTKIANPDINAAVSASRNWLIYQDAPNFAMASYKTSGLVVRTATPDLTAVEYGARFVFVFVPPPGAMYGARYAFLINQVEVGSPVYTTQAFSLVTQKSIWPPVSEVYSTSSDIQTVQVALVKNTDNTFAWSHTRVAAMPILTLLARDAGHPISLTRMLQNRMLVLRASPLDTQSWKSLASIAHLTLVSLDRAVVPTSGVFVGEFATMSLLAKPMSGMPRSYNIDLQVAQLALQKNPRPMPRSNTRVLQHFIMALRPNSQPLARGSELAKQHFLIALQANPMPPLNDPTYRKPAEAAQDFQLALMKQSLAFPWVGVEHSKQTAHLTLMQSPVVTGYGVIHDKLLVTLALQSSPMEKPGSMSGANMPSLRTTIIMARPLLPASQMVSTTSASQVGLKWLVDATYQKPGDVVTGSKYSFYNTLHILTTMARALPLPLSFTRVPEMALLTTQHAKYDPPMKVFNDGLFVSLIGEQVMTVEQYPTTGEPVSQLTADSIIEQLVVTDDTFPSKSYSTSQLQATAVAEQVAAVDDSFPDKDLARSMLQASQIAEQVAEADGTFPNPNIPQAQLVVTHIAENLAVRADDYPPKDMVLSSLVVTSLVENVVSRDTFPDKDVPQSAIAVSQVVEFVMTVDDTMKGLPQYQGRRKPTIFVQIVY